MDDPFLPETQQLIAPWDAEERLRTYLPAWQRNWTSDDYVEMTWYAPTVRFYTARPALRVPAGHSGYPSWVLNALGGIPATIDPTVRTTGTVIAGTLLDLLRQPDTLAAAKAEHVRRIEEYGALDALLPADFTAPIDYRWPEYVDTPRGRGWWIPNNPEI
jgi:aminobenzoyl-glutamate utilization protein B